MNKDVEQKQKELHVKKLVQEVQRDFELRQKERMPLERQWELNMNFMAGNQYCGINSRGEILDDDKTFYWQNRGVFNHIAPIIETKLAKFSRLQPAVSVRPKTDDDKDVLSAEACEKLIANAFKCSDMDSVVRKVNSWSEVCGTGFYKVVWDNNGGELVGQVDGIDVFEGQVKVLPVSPFEIFPDSLYHESIEECNSIIHARAMSTHDIFEKYGVTLKGEEIGVFNLSTKGAISTTKNTISDGAIVIERYEKPSKQFSLGRLVTIAQDKLLYEGDLPYANGNNNSRTFPFVKQESTWTVGMFFGSSVVERLIPVQKAFNAVKNRKHEFLNRLSMGVMTVEDGSVDVDDLEQEGLSPGKVLVYRQGSKAPEMMNEFSMPSDFNEEESKLINEFVIVSGVSDVSSSATNATLSSGSALEILVEQDNSRLIMTADVIRRAFLEVAKQTIRLYAQFLAGVRAVRYFDDQNNIKILYADRDSFTSDDVYLESENELLYSNSRKKEMIFKLFNSGLLSDEKGKLRPSTKEKVLALLGYKDLDYQKGIARLQEEKAQRENEMLKKGLVATEEIDEHSIHIDEHVRYVLSEYLDLTENNRKNFFSHIKEHKEKLKLINEEVK